MLVLVALEDDYRAYREVLAVGVGALRPSIEVRTTNPAGLEVEIKHFKPQVVISSQPEAAADPNDVSAWIELSVNPLPVVCWGQTYGLESLEIGLRGACKYARIQP